MNMEALLAVRREPEPVRHQPVGVWVLILLMLILLALAVQFLPDAGSDIIPVSPTPTAVSEQSERVYTVSYRSGVFSPTNLRIRAGDSVRFRNDGLFSVRIVSDLEPRTKLPLFDSVGTIPPGSYFSYTFAAAGVIGYHNDANEQEAGVIIVR